MSRPIVEITHRQEFCASHRLHAPSLGDAENRELYGVCNNPNGHGHNYLLEVTVRGEVDPVTGMVMDLNRLGRIVHERVIQRVDHKHLNFDVAFLEGVVPTAENAAVAFWREIEPGLSAYPGCRLHRIRLWESRNNLADYYGPSPAR
jgi:6-pyruvoyltetrahydropterin/6-carboxytetrahydropterin synthase